MVQMAIHKSNSNRFVELDVLRGFAITFMVFLHILWDLDYFGVLPLNKQIYQFQAIVPMMFFVLVGMCLAVSINRKLNLPLEEQKKYKQHLILRGMKIFSLGMIITTVTLILMPGRPIVFGVLHCIGLSIVLSVPFLKYRAYNILFAAAIVLVGCVIGGFVVENPTAFHLAIGLHQSNMAIHTIDYFPLLPWFGMSLLGIALGNWLYKDNKRRFEIPDISKYKPMSVFSWLGKHSLAIYLLHQPIIAGALSIYLII